jgi:hypothetical protein
MDKLLAGLARQHGYRLVLARQIAGMALLMMPAFIVAAIVTITGN